MVKGWGSEQFLRYMTFNVVEGRGMAPGTFETLLQNVILISIISPKFQKIPSNGYWELVRTKLGRIFAFPQGTISVCVWPRRIPGGPPGWFHWMCLIIRKQECISSKDGDLNSFWDIWPFMKWRGEAWPRCSPGDPRVGVTECVLS